MLFPEKDENVSVSRSLMASSLLKGKYIYINIRECMRGFVQHITAWCEYFLYYHVLRELDSDFIDIFYADKP